MGFINTGQFGNFNPRDFDSGQPMIKDLKLVRKFWPYLGLKYSAFKLEKWLNDFEFSDVATAVKKINWLSVPVAEL